MLFRSEVMALDRCFEGALLKAVRSLEIGVNYEAYREQSQRHHDDDDQHVEQHSKMAYQIKKNAGHVKTGIKTKICFYFMRMLHTRGWDEADLAYWSKKGWDREKRPWKNNKGV